MYTITVALIHAYVIKYVIAKHYYN